MAGRAAGLVGIVALVLAVAFAWLPTWALFMLTVAPAKGLTILGLVLLIRAGLVSFGQGLYYAIGAYTVGFLSDRLGIHDVFVVTAAAVIVAVAIAALVGLLMVQYREIFFAMLSLAFSMILYGLLVTNEAFGSTDGIGAED
jgi:branched-chain amino acid transport system permease protein